MTSAAEVGLPEVDIPMPTIVIGPTARVDKEIIRWSALGHLTWSSRLLSVVCVSCVVTSNQKTEQDRPQVAIGK